MGLKIDITVDLCHIFICISFSVCKSHQVLHCNSSLWHSMFFDKIIYSITSVELGSTSYGLLCIRIDRRRAILMIILPNKIILFCRIFEDSSRDTTLLYFDMASISRLFSQPHLALEVHPMKMPFVHPFASQDHEQAIHPVG